MTKRAFDVVAATLAAIVLAPVAAGVALVVRLSGRGPILHRATRAGRHGQPFTLLKFRTMRPDAHLVGPPVTAREDPRITTAGRVLRRFKLDELPQLLNVIRGDMSLVGPRPEDLRYVAGYTAAQRRALDVRPGITSPATVLYRHEERILAGAADLEDHYVTEVLPTKLAIDLAYVAHQSLAVDLRVLAATAVALVRQPAATRLLGLLGNPVPATPSNGSALSGAPDPPGTHLA